MSRKTVTEDQGTSPRHNWSSNSRKIRELISSLPDSYETGKREKSYPAGGKLFAKIQDTGSPENDKQVIANER